MFDAIDGRVLDVDKMASQGSIDPAESQKEIGRLMRKGEYGCYLSHTTIWDKFVQSDKKYLLVLEDDAILDKDLKYKLSYYLKQMNDNGTNWDLLYLNENCDFFLGKEECSGDLISGSDYFIKPKNIGFCTHGYIISRELIKHFSDTDLFPMVRPIDVYIIKKQKEMTDKNFLRLKTPIIHVDNKRSDTQKFI